MDRGWIGLRRARGALEHIRSVSGRDVISDFRQRMGLRLAAALDSECEYGIIWFPVFICAGLGVYFHLRSEPSLILMLLLAVAGTVLWLICWRGSTSRLALIASFVVMGLAWGAAAGAMRTALLDTPVLIWRTGGVELTGRVIMVEGEPGRRRKLIIDVEQIDGLKNNAAPSRVQLAMGRAAADLAAGDRIRLRARLMPLGGPVLPGGFDYGRQLWFRGIGATGYGMGEVTLLPKDGRFLPQVSAQLERVRSAVGERLRSVLAGETAGMAVALTIGDRSGISDGVTREFQISGLAHVISISGMHMSMVAGSSFFLIRALLALLPALALRAPIKKIAAAGALAIATGYFLISGFDVATQRAYVMVAIMLIAVMVDRPAVSMRNVALSALVVLAFHPEAVLSASFHLSFLAVIALVACFEHWKAFRQSRRRDEPRVGRRLGGRLIRIIGTTLLVSLATTAIAGTATAPIAAYHFQRYSTYSLLANLIATPVVGLLVMPFLMLGLVFMPLGLYAPFLHVAGFGIDLMLAIARMIARLPGADGVVQAQPTFTAIMIVAGILAACLCRSWLRWSSLALVAIGLAAAPFEARPSALVEAEGKVVGLRNGHGALALSNGRRGTYSAGVWLARFGDRAGPTEAAGREGLSCVEGSCRGMLGNVPLAIVDEPDRLGEACGSARVVISPLRIREPCPSADILIDRKVLLAEGALQLEPEPSGGIRVISARALSGDRPWVIANRRYQPRPSQPLWITLNRGGEAD